MPRTSETYSDATAYEIAVRATAGRAPRGRARKVASMIEVIEIRIVTTRPSRMNGAHVGDSPVELPVARTTRSRR